MICVESPRVSAEQIIFLLIVAVTLMLFIGERIRIDVAAFLTPIGHHGNLLILNPGQYTFGDFLRVGIPLTICISVVSVWMAQWLWLGGPLIPDWSALGVAIKGVFT